MICCYLEITQRNLKRYLRKVIVKIRIERTNTQKEVSVEVLLDSSIRGLVMSSEFTRKLSYVKSNFINNLSFTVVLSFYKILYIAYLLQWYYSLTIYPFITYLLQQYYSPVYILLIEIKQKLNVLLRYNKNYATIVLNYMLKNSKKSTCEHKMI